MKHCKVVERFLQYVAVDTQSDENSTTSPSTEKQQVLAGLLYEQLCEMGASSVYYDREHCYVYAKIPATDGYEKVPVVGFISHMDTSPAVSGEKVKASFVYNYDGNDILLNEEQNIVMEKINFPELETLKGMDLIVTDGTTLLGADDKAGIAEIMTMAETYLTTKEPHGGICIAFTPDEEIGCGTDFFDLERFGADVAYTVDGGALGELEYENFNAASGKLTVYGCNVHPGSAKGKMKNAILIAQEFQRMLPVEQNPMYTEGYEGFFHPDSINGNVEMVEADYIIRDHDAKLFADKKDIFIKCANFLNDKYGKGTVVVKVEDSYYNMKEKLKDHMYLVELACESMKELDVEPIITPIRGGTDGARLTFLGLPCPNLCTGGANFHSRFEYLCVQSMEKTVDIIVKIVEKMVKM